MDNLVVLNQIHDNIANLDQTYYQTILNIFDQYDRVFLVGAGRSRLVANMFAMRLMHCGKNVHVVGDYTTPSIGPNDLLIIISNTGETKQLIGFVEKANNAGSSTLLITANKKSSLVSISEQTLQLDINKNDLPLGTSFELTCLIFLETCISSIINKYNIEEDELKRRHANLE